MVVCPTKSLITLPSPDTKGKECKSFSFTDIIRVMTFVFFVFFQHTISFSQAPVISYPTPNSYYSGNSISPLTPQNSGGPIPSNGYAQVSTIAGSLPGFQDGHGTTAYFNQPAHITIDSKKNLYVTDIMNYRIRKITPSGDVTTFAGSGIQGDLPGTGSDARFSFPIGIVADKNDNIYLTDYFSNKIKKITPAGLVTDYAGNGTNQEVDGQGIFAGVATPSGLAIDFQGNLYFTTGKQTVRKIDLYGNVSFLAGQGTVGYMDGQGNVARFHNALGPSVDHNGNIFVADESNHRIRKITPGGLVSTIAGTGAIGSQNGSTGSATFNFPQAVTVDNLGNIYVADGFNNCIRKISSNGLVTTLAGSGVAGNQDGNGLDAEFNVPTGLITDNEGALFIVDSFNSTIRKLTLTGYKIDKQLPEGLIFDTATGVISGTPVNNFPLTTYTVTAFNKDGSSDASFNIEVLSNPLIPSVITFDQPDPTLDAANNVTLFASSTNNQTPITFSGNNPAVATCSSDGKVHVIGPGTITITASQSGNSIYADATPVSRQITFIFGQVITFPLLNEKTTCDNSFSAHAESSNQLLPLIYTSSNEDVAVIDGNGNITIKTAGTTTIIVSQPGNEFYHSAIPVQRVLKISPPIQPQVSISPEQPSACPGSPVTMIANVTYTGSVSFQWYKNDVPVGTNSSELTLQNLTAEDKIACKVTSLGSCTLTAFSNTYSGYHILPTLIPQLHLSMTPTSPVCVGKEITFVASPENGGVLPKYQWRVNGTDLNISGPVFKTKDLQNGDVVTCRLVSNAAPCLLNNTADALPETVSIIPLPNPMPEIAISGSESSITAGQTVIFTAVFINSLSSATYNWQINGITFGDNSNQFVTKALKNGDKISCVVTFNVNCGVTVTSNEIEMIVAPAPSIRIVNTFSPNSDGINDKWEIPDLSNYSQCKVRIFTRSGTLLFSSSGYYSAWDGTYSGIPVPTGVYYYIIDPGDGVKTMTGSLTILR